MPDALFTASSRSAGFCRSRRQRFITASHVALIRNIHTRGQWCQKNSAEGRAIGKTKGGLNSKLHLVCDGNGRPVSITLTAGNKADITQSRQCLEPFARQGPSQLPWRVLGLSSSLMFAFDAALETRKWQHFLCWEEPYVGNHAIATAAYAA